MADETNPGTGVAEVDFSRFGATLDSGEEKFLSKFMGRREPAEANPEPQEQAQEAETPDDDEPGEDAETNLDDEESQTTDEGEAEPEPESDADDAEADDADPLPDNFRVNDLAEALGTKPEELLSRLRVTTDDGELTLAEVRDGYLRQADYTRKTQSHAEKVKAETAKIEKQQAELSQREQFVQDSLGYLAQDIASYPSDDQLLSMLDPSSQSYDPDGYHRIRAEKGAKEDRFNQMMAEFERRRSAARQEHAAKVQEHNKAQEKRLLEALPSLKEAPKRSEFVQNIRQYLTESGYSEKQVEQYFNGAWDAGHILMVDKARRFDELEKNRKKAKPLKALPKVQKPGAQKSEKDNSAARAAKLRDRLKRTGRNKQANEAAALDVFRDLASRSNKR